MPPMLDAPTGGDSYAEVRHIQGDFTAMVHLDVQAPWLPLGDFRPSPEGIDTPASQFTFEVDTSRRATPTTADLVETSKEAASTAIAPAFFAPEHGAEHEAAVRVELLARKYAASLSPEENARLKVATEKLRRLLPRVTAEDFEALAEVSEKIAETGREVEDLRRELGLEE